MRLTTGSLIREHRGILISWVFWGKIGNDTGRSMAEYTIVLAWDDEARVWIAESEGIQLRAWASQAREIFDKTNCYTV